MAQWRCGFALESGQPCGEAVATYGGFCDAHMLTVETCLCGAPALGEAALADDMYTAHPTLCEDCAALTDIWACGNCGRLGTKDIVETHSKNTHYTIRPRGTSASAETVAQCLASLPAQLAPPICGICNYALHNYDDLLHHAGGHRRIGYDHDSAERPTQCPVHGFDSVEMFRGGFCRLCIRRHPETLQWVCERCGEVEVGPEGPAHHHGECRRYLFTGVHYTGDIGKRASCVCGDTRVLASRLRTWGERWLVDHFVPAHVASLACPLDGCRRLFLSSWADADMLRRHIMGDHNQALQPMVGYREPVQLSVRNAFVEAHNARLQSDTPTTSSDHRRMLCSAAWLVEDSRRFSTDGRFFLLADYMLALNSPGPLLRELCWDSTPWPNDINVLRAAVVARFNAVTEPRCIPVGSRKSYVNLPTDIWRVIMKRLPYKDALALGQTCRRLWAVYEDIWPGLTVDALLAWLRILPTDIHREGLCDTCGMDDAKDYFALADTEIMHELGRSKDGYYPLRGLARTALLKYGSVEAFKKAYVEKLAEGFFTDSDADYSPDYRLRDYEYWEEEEDGEAVSGEGSGDNQGESGSGSESE